MPEVEELRADRPLPRSLDVPVSRVAAGRGLPGRIAAVAVGTAIAVAIAVAATSGRPSDARLDRLPALPSGAPDAPSDGTEPPTVAQVAPAPSISPRPFLPLPSIANTPLYGAPVLAFWRRDGQDLIVSGWHAGESGVRTEFRVPGILAGLGDTPLVIASVSPDGRFVAASAVNLTGTTRGEEIRVADRSGTVVWRRAFPEAGFVPAAWAPSGDRLVVADGDRWRIITVPGSGRATAGDEIVAQPLRAAADPGSSGAATVADATARLSRATPIAFSADGGTVFAATTDDAGNSWPAFRIDLATGRTFPIDRLPGALAPAAFGGSGGALGAADPATGRLLPPIPPTDGRLRVLGADAASTALTVERGTIFGAAWIGEDGRLAVLSDGSAPGTRSSDHPTDGIGPLVLEVVDRSGRTLVRRQVAGIVRGAGIAPGPTGYVLLGITADHPADVLLVLERVADGASASVRLPTEGVDPVQFLGWLPPG